MQVPPGIIICVAHVERLKLGKVMRRAASTAGWNALWSWIDVAMRYAEMTAAASQVVAHRTRRIVAAGANPNTRDRREFSLMRQEKIDATTLSAQMVGTELMRINYRLGAQAWLNMLRATTNMLSLAASRTPSQAVARQARLARTLRRSAPTLASASSATASLTRAAMKPVHVRATRNAKRLYSSSAGGSKLI
jgi:hypothetical protein